MQEGHHRQRLDMNGILERSHDDEVQVSRIRVHLASAQAHVDPRLVSVRRSDAHDAEVRQHVVDRAGLPRELLVPRVRPEVADVPAQAEQGLVSVGHAESRGRAASSTWGVVDLAMGTCCA